MHLAPLAADFRESLQAGKRFLFARVGKQKVLGVLRFEAPCVAGVGEQREVGGKARFAAGKLVTVEHFVNQRRGQTVNILDRVGVHAPDGDEFALAGNGRVAEKAVRTGHQCAVQTGLAPGIQREAIPAEAVRQRGEIKLVQAIVYSVPKGRQVHEIRSFPAFGRTSVRMFCCTSARKRPACAPSICVWWNWKEMGSTVFRSFRR